MPGNAFIKFTGANGPVPGESLQETHPSKDGWLEISDWSWDIEAETNFTKGTGASVGKPQPGRLSFTHSYDKSSPTLLKNIILGTHFKTMQLNMLKQTGDGNGKPQVYFELMAAGVFVCKVSSKGGEDGAVTQDVEVVFKEVSVGYKRQQNNGKLDPAVPFNWNIATMTMSVTDAKLALA